MTPFAVIIFVIILGGGKLIIKMLKDDGGVADSDKALKEHEKITKEIINGRPL